MVDVERVITGYVDDLVAATTAQRGTSGYLAAAVADQMKPTLRAQIRDSLRAQVESGQLEVGRLIGDWNGSPIILRLTENDQIEGNDAIVGVEISTSDPEVREEVGLRLERREEGWVIVALDRMSKVLVPLIVDRKDREYFRAEIRSALKNLAAQQEIHYADTYTYTTDKDALGLWESQGVTVTIANASTRGWAGSAVHAALPAWGCAIYYGPATPVATAGGKTPSRAGTIVCDDAP